VAFVEVERFLDTPIKRYSSGMYVRLCFAVAAHLEPNILIVDGVLAVGDAEFQKSDAEFQKKCIGKMDEVAATGGRALGEAGVEAIITDATLPAERMIQGSLPGHRRRTKLAFIRRMVTDWPFA
jgi:hypothetical protein